MEQALDRRLVAVMFTDMVGYTSLLEADERSAVRHRDAYIAAVERQHAALGGTIVQRLGDGTMSMFPSALAAVQAAIAIQQQLARDSTSARIGIHVGEVIVEQERLTGEAVNHASRVESFAVSGAVFVSEATRDQLKNRDDLTLVTLGRFRLKGARQPVEIYAVDAEGLAVPDPRTLEGKGDRFASLSSRVPEPAFALLGRERDLDAIRELVRSDRIVTITGPGGVGKTRVLIDLGRTLETDFVDGVAFVSLADALEPDAFVPAVAALLDVKETEERSLIDGIIALIGDRSALLLLDNLEQIVGAAGELARIVDACPQLHVVTTSRTPLRIQREIAYSLAPLELPSAVATDAEAADIARLAANPSIALLVERARAVKREFAITPENAASLAEICRRLDGLPLALELAAARLRIMSASALLDRLNRALSVLTTGPRGVPERQQTLRATIDWSHSLLTEPEQLTFRRMAVFTGGSSLEDVEAVSGEDAESVLDDVESLVDKALVQVDPRSDRLRLLQTIREFASERLEAAGETRDIALRHADRYAGLALHIRDGIEGTSELEVLERGIVDEGNLLAALDTFLAAARGGDAIALERGMQMTGDLYFYWHIRGKNVTALEYATAFLDSDTGVSRSVGRAGALITAGIGCWVLGDFQRAADLWHDAHEIATDCNAARERCMTAFFQALALISTDVAEAERWSDLGLELGRATSFTWAVAWASTFSGLVQAVLGRTERAETLLRDGLAIQQRLGDHEGAGLSLGGLAGLVAARGELSEALRLYEQSLAAFATCGDRAEEARILNEMAWTFLRQGQPDDARHAFFDSVRAYTDVGSVRGVGLSLIGLAATEAVEQRPERAVQIAAAAEVYARGEGIVNVYSDETPGREFVGSARTQLSADVVERATARGRQLTIKQALELAGAAPPAHAAPPADG